ncbi:hypothetical protein PPACK8108_LOCUS8224, partial [Phakopsora pachyrhizi]
LLGFTLAPRPQQIHSNFTHGTRRPTRKNQSNHNRFDQEIFVHAKYRFILKPTGDYTAHFADPDIRFNWPDVLQVIVNTSSSRHNLGSNKGPAILAQEDPQISQLACPICLSPPTAPRMTRCGHIFCYPCLLHYIELSDEGKGQGRKCPVCWVAVYKKDLKSVKWFDCAAEAARHSEPTSSLMCFRLVERPNFTTLALPRSPTWSSHTAQSLQTPWHFTPDALAFVKFMLATPDYMKTELQRDLEELEEELATLSKWSVVTKGSEDLSIMFVRTAEAKVKEQIEKASLLKTNFVMTSRKQALKQIADAFQPEKTTPALQHIISSNLGTMMSTDEDEAMIKVVNSSESKNLCTTDKLQESTKSEIIDHCSSTALPFNVLSRIITSKLEPSSHSPALAATPKVRRNVNPSEPISSAYRFYQAASGENIYLSSLDVRILLEKFESYDKFPDFIALEVEAYVEGRVNSEFRRRCKYLSHLSVGSEVVMAEVVLDNYLTSSSPLFAAVRQRRSKRKEKVRREDKAKARIELSEKLSHPTELLISAPLLSSEMRTSKMMDDFPETRASPDNNPVDKNAANPSAQHLKAGNSKTVWGTVIPARKSPPAEDLRPGLGNVWEALESLDDKKTDGEPSCKPNYVNEGRGISSATRGKRNWKSNKVTINISGGYGGRAT